MINNANEKEIKLKKLKEKLLIGFIGQGWIGKNYADDFEKRGYKTVRYGLEGKYIHNKDRIGDCDMVFIAVPTPTTPNGFDVSALRSALKLVSVGKIAVIKSTILPGTTEMLNSEFEGVHVLHCPEFLSKVSAAHDAEKPERNIVGYPTESSKEYAEQVLSVLPKAPYELVCKAKNAEIIKYARNVPGLVNIMIFNILFDWVKSFGADWEVVSEAMEADPLIAKRYLSIIHDGGRGAGGCCFPKDFAAFLGEAKKNNLDSTVVEVLESLQALNVKLLTKSGKSLDILDSIFGKSEPEICMVS